MQGTKEETSAAAGRLSFFLPLSLPTRTPTPTAVAALRFRQRAVPGCVCRAVWLRLRAGNRPPALMPNPYGGTGPRLSSTSPGRGRSTRTACLSNPRPRHSANVGDMASGMERQVTAASADCEKGRDRDELGEDFPAKTFLLFVLSRIQKKK